MKLIINGQTFEATSACLANVLDEFEAKPPYAVAVNGDFVSQSDYASTELNSNDQVDVVSPIYGG